MTSADDPPLRRIHDASVQQPRPPRRSLPMVPSRLDHDETLFNGTGDVATDLETLVHRLNRRPIFQDSLRRRFMDKERGKRESEWVPERNGFRPSDGRDARPTEMPMPPQPLAPTPALGLIPELSMQCDPCPPPIPPPCESPQQPSLYQSDSLVPDAPSEDRSPVRISDVKRPRRATDVRLHKSASNLRMLDLVTGMIENGVQCNVQNSTPPSPTKASWTSSGVPPSMRHIEPQDTVDSHLSPGRMQLEVDMGFSEPDEETLLGENMALRNAAIPAGIKKFGLLRYRSSTEAALSCKNMKKSVPRMRRRRRTDTTASSEPPTSKPPPAAA